MARGILPENDILLMEYYERMHSISKSSRPTLRFIYKQAKIGKVKLFRPKGGGNLNSTILEDKVTCYYEFRALSQNFSS